MEVIMFWILAVIIVASAIATVFSKNIIYSAFSLLFSFLGVAGIYAMLSADFLAVTQIMVYVGGILTLLLFGVMLTNRITTMSLKTDVFNFVPGLIIAAVMLASLLYVIWVTGTWAKQSPAGWDTTVESIGTLTITHYLLPFETIAILLLVAVVGASYVARKDKQNIKS